MMRSAGAACRGLKGFKLQHVQAAKLQALRSALPRLTWTMVAGVCVSKNTSMMVFSTAGNFSTQCQHVQEHFCQGPSSAEHRLISSCCAD